MRRVLSIALVLLVVFVAAVLAGFWVAARLAPERLRVVAEQQLARALHGQVTLARLEIARSSRLPWLWLEVRGARAVLRDDVTLLVGRVRARLDPLSLVLGRLGLADLKLEDVIVMFPPRPDEHPERDLVAKILRPMEVSGGFLRQHPCDVPDLEVVGLTLLVPRDHKLDVLLEGGVGRHSCEGFSRDRSSAELVARARRAEATFPASFTLQVSRDVAALNLSLEGVPLAPLLGAIEIDLPLAGRVSGTARLSAPADGTHRLDLALDGGGVSGPVPAGAAEPWLALDLAAPRLTGSLVTTPTGVVLEETELTDGGLRLLLSGEMQRPARSPSRARLQASLDALPLRTAPRLLAQLPPGPRRDAERVLARLTSGSFEAVHTEIDGTLGDIADAARASVLAHPGLLHLEAGVRGTSVELGEGDIASQVDAHVAFSGDRLELAVTRGRYHEQPLPELALAMSGISNLHSFEEFSCRTPQPQPPLPGIPRLRDWLLEEREDPAERSSAAWQRLTLDLDWVSHPALLCGLEQVSAQLEPSAQGLRFTAPLGIWAGLPIQLDGDWQRPEDSGAGRVAVRAKLGPPFEAMSLDPPAQPWLSGRFRFEASRLGRWHVRGASGRITAEGTHLDLPATTLLLAPEGEIEGHTGIDLGRADTLPFAAEAQFTGVELLNLWKAADLERGALDGTLFGAGAITGELRPGLNPLGDARGLLALHARDGQVNRKIPIMLAIALASDQFNPFGSREQLPYQAIDAVARVGEGKLVFETVQLHAPTLRMGANGAGGVVAPYALEGVVGLFFFPGLDSLIERVPLLNRVILGRNGNLVGAYFQVTGGWGEPEASLIPIQTIATGPTGFLTEGIPAFVLGGIRRIQSVILPGEESKASQDGTDS